MEAQSVLYWVQDGVVVDQENLFDGTTHCSVACFLNATELPTDLTGLHLTESPERSRRAQAARQSLAESLGELGQLAQSLKDLEAKVKTMSWALGIGVFLVGVGAYWIAPQLGFSIIVFGTLGVQALESKESQRAQRVRKGVEELQQALKGQRVDFGVAACPLNAQKSGILFRLATRFRGDGVSPLRAETFRKEAQEVGLAGVSE